MSKWKGQKDPRCRLLIPGVFNGLTVQGFNDIIPVHVENGGKRFL